MLLYKHIECLNLFGQLPKIAFIPLILKSTRQAQRFVTAHAAFSNVFNLGRHLVRAEHYRDLRMSAFEEWSRAVA